MFVHIFRAKAAMVHAQSFFLRPSLETKIYLVENEVRGCLLDYQPNEDDLK